MCPYQDCPASAANGEAQPALSGEGDHAGPFRDAPVWIVPAVWLNGRLKQQVEPPCMAQPAASSFTLSSAILRLYRLGVDHPLENDGAIGIHVHADNVAIHKDALQKGV